MTEKEQARIHLQTPEGLQPLLPLDETPDIEAEEVKWPKENPYIEITPEETAARSIEALQQEFVNLFLKPLFKVIQRCAEIVNRPDNKRVKHLALHAKKQRIRKKNARRLAREIIRRTLKDGRP